MKSFTILTLILFLRNTTALYEGNTSHNIGEGDIEMQSPPVPSLPQRSEETAPTDPNTQFQTDIANNEGLAEISTITLLKRLKDISKIRYPGSTRLKQKAKHGIIRRLAYTTSFINL